MAEQAQIQRVVVNGTELAYVEAGRGEPVFLIHGSLDDWRTWRYQIEPLAEQYRVIAYSRRWHYPNGWTDAGLPYSAKIHVDDLGAIMAALGVESARVVASSYGGVIALYFTYLNPGRVSRLVLGEPPLLHWLPALPGGPALLDGFLNGYWNPAGEAFRRGDEEQGVGLFLDGVLGAGTFAQLPARARATLMQNAPEMAAETRTTEFAPPLQPDDVRGINIPVLLLTGENSPRMFHVITDELTRCLPNVQRANIARATHVMHQGNAADYNRIVLQFLAGY